jgi:uncharacterized iron-regulated membrane protein
MHFYAGMFALPFIVLMAVTGLVILYTEPILDATQADLRHVTASAERVSYDEQVAAVERAYPDAVVTSLTPPSAADRSTIVGLDSASLHGPSSQAFVNPHTGAVLGTANADGGIVGLSNRLHGFLNIESVMVPLPAVSALWDGGPVIRDYVLFDLVLEVLGVWTLVLVITGLYLFWPRRGIAARRSLTGRAKWRRLHGISGVALSSMMVLTLISGLAWSTYWGSNFASLADTLTPGAAVEAPPSEIGKRADLDVLGNQINWNTGEYPIPASYAPTDASMPAPMRLDDVVTIAQRNGMKPGYTIYLPTNVVDESGVTTFGAFTVSNSWPRTTGDARDLFLDQFSGDTLAEQQAYGMGTISYGMDVLVSTHMGTQLGLFSRILMTALCVLAIWSVISALTMFVKRRRPGTAGLPRRPADVRLGRPVLAIAAALAVAFPQWALTALAVAAIDRWVIRRVPRLRVAFGQR